MTASRATSEPKTVFTSLQTLSVGTSFRTLLANEKVAAREEFLRAFDRAAERVRTGCWALSGLDAGGDLLVLRASAHLEDLHAAPALVANAGLGRHLTATQTFLGTAPASHAPEGRVLCAIPLAAAPKGAAPAGARLTVLDGRGLGPAPWLALLEGDDPLAGRHFLAAEGTAPAGPVRVGLRGEVRDIVDSF